MRRALARVAVAALVAALFAAWLAPANVLAWVLAGAAPCG